MPFLIIAADIGVPALYTGSTRFYWKIKRQRQHHYTGFKNQDLESCSPREGSNEFRCKQNMGEVLEIHLAVLCFRLFPSLVVFHFLRTKQLIGVPFADCDSTYHDLRAHDLFLLTYNALAQGL